MSFAVPFEKPVPSQAKASLVMAQQVSNFLARTSHGASVINGSKHKTRPTPQAQPIRTNLLCHSLGHGTHSTGPEELGLLSVFSACVAKVGYFRPIGRFSVGDGSGCRTDYRIELMKKYFGLNDENDDNVEAMFGVSEDQAWEMLASGPRRQDQLYERILEKYLRYAAKKDFVLVSTFTEQDDSLHFAAKLCSALNLPAILIGDAIHDTQFAIAQSAFQQHCGDINCVVGTIVSEVKDPAMEYQKLQSMKLRPLAILPRNEILSKRTMREALKVLGPHDGVCLYGVQYLDSTVDNMRINTVHVADLLDHVQDHELVIVNHNRIDSLMSLLLAAQSSSAPTPAGILFTSYYAGAMNPKIASLLDGLKDHIRIPILATSLDTINAVQALDRTPQFLMAENKQKVAEAITRMALHFDFSFLDKLFKQNPEHTRDIISPRMFQYSTCLKARQLKKTIVLPEGADPRVVEAASVLVKSKLCNVILLGDYQVVQANAQKQRVSLEGITLVDPQSYKGLEKLVNAFVEARKSKGLTVHEAEKYLKQDVNYFGTLMVHLGLADGMVSGAMHSSANTMRPAFQILKTAPGASLASSVFFMLLEDGVKVMGDCAINTSPNSDQLAEIAIQSAKTCLQFGINPRVALLSYATGDSNKGKLIDKVIQATAKAKKAAEKEGFMDPNMIAGPLQFDAAVNPTIAAVKAKNCPVAGRANVLIFPDLNAGNNGYKAIQQTSKSIAVGPILQGLRKPVNDLSRGATVDDIVNTAVLTAIQTSLPDLPPLQSRL